MLANNFAGWCHTVTFLPTGRPLHLHFDPRGRVRKKERISFSQVIFPFASILFNWGELASENGKDEVTSQGQYI